MSVVTEEHIRRLVYHTLNLEDQQRPSVECYPLYAETLCYLFSKINTDCKSKPISEESLKNHEKLLNLAKSLIDKSLSHYDLLHKPSETSKTEVKGDTSAISGIKEEGEDDSRVSDIQSETKQNNTHAPQAQPELARNSSPTSDGQPEVARNSSSSTDGQRDSLRRRSDIVLRSDSPVTDRQGDVVRESQRDSQISASSSMDRRASTLSSSSSTSMNLLTPYAPLTMDNYKTFMPQSPIQKAESDIRRLQARFDATEQRLSSRRRGGGSETTTRLLTLDRKKVEIMEIAKKGQEEFLNSVRQHALRACNDSAIYFRCYRDHFTSPHLQLLYRQATLYNLFHLHSHTWYQKMVAGRRSAERCLAFLIRDRRHPVVPFVFQMVSRYLGRLRGEESIDSVAQDLKDELQKVAEILTLVIRHSNATPSSQLPEINEDEAEDLLPLLSRAMFTQTQDGIQLHHLALSTLRTSLHAELEALGKTMSMPGDQQRHITEVDPSLLAATHNDDVAAFAEGRELLREIQRRCCPFDKLHIINKAASTIVDVSMRISGRENARDLGADEIQPLITYAALCWQEPDLLIQCHFLDKFAMGKSLLGIEGYSLVSLQSAVTFLAEYK